VFLPGADGSLEWRRMISETGMAGVGEARK
jgi:hypothetical protein